VSTSPWTIGTAGNLDSWVTRNRVNFHVGLFFALVLVFLVLLAVLQRGLGALAVKRWLLAADIFFGCAIDHSFGVVSNLICFRPCWSCCLFA
jgi:hypothetical protein